jgi:hypothetical protein
MLWSVIVLAISAFVSAGVSIVYRDNNSKYALTETHKAPPCKDGLQTCKPWERDWGNTRLKPGSLITDQGAIIEPAAKQ